MPAPPARKQGSANRWINVVLRTVHLLSVMALGARVLTGSAPLADTRIAALLVLLSGLAMFVLDFMRNPSHLREVAGVGIVLKLALCGWMVLHPSLAVPLFWILLLVSSILSHAPKSFRHHVWLPKG